MGTVTGGTTNSISWGTATQVFPATITRGAQAPYFSAKTDGLGRILVVYMDASDGANNEYNDTDGKAIVITVTGGSTNSISVGNVNKFHSHSSGNPTDSFEISVSNANTVVYDPDKQSFQALFGIGGNTTHGKLKSLTLNASSATTNSARYIGFAQSAVSNGAAIKVDVSGATNNNQSSLTAGSIYYVQDDGTIATTSSSVKAGIALSATKLLIKG